MKSKLFSLSLIALALLLASSCKPTVTFTEGPLDPETGKGTYSIVIDNPPKGDNWAVWFSCFRVRPQILEGSNATIEHLFGTLHKITPTADCKDKVVINFLASPLRRQSWAPEKFTLDIPGMSPVELETEYIFQEAKDVPLFEYETVELDEFDIVPKPKIIDKRERKSILGVLSVDEIAQKWQPDTVAGKVPGWYRIDIMSGEVNIQASDADGAFYAAVTLSKILRNGEGEVTNVTIEDWPDLQYRGLMLDVARNFTTKDNVLKLIDVLAGFKVNVLHLHIADDEGWRIEIPGIPQLTAFSAFHSLPVRQADGSYKEITHLAPTHSGDFDPNAGGSSTGFYTKADYIEIVKYAHKNHIRVIPEIDTPGHFRAALRGMDYYCDQTGDESLRLTEPGDTSKYYSVQYFNDNALNVALNSSYKFMNILMDTFIAYHNEAGVPLTEFHVGGDEVPGGAWMGSPACQALMQENGWTGAAQLKAYFLRRVMSIAEAKGIKIAGWQETPQRLDTKTEDQMKRDLAFTNIWSTRPEGHSDELPYKMANKGFNVILCNMTNAYADFAYNSSVLERGHDWGGLVDERRSFCLLPFNSYSSVRFDDSGAPADLTDAATGKTVLEAPERIMGVQAQLWTETIRNFDHVTYYIFPKMIGLWERGWNAHPVWEFSKDAQDPAFTEDFNRFFSTVEQHEMPWFDQLGICYHKR